MKRISWLLLFVFPAPGLRAQSLTVPALNSVWAMPIDSATSYLKSHDFFLVEKKKESGFSSYYYTSLNKGQDGIAWVRSLTLLQASSGAYTGRMLSYRTYNREEYESMLKYFLNHRFATGKSFVMGDEQHTIYKKDGREYRVKISHEPLPGGKKVRAYELEFGG